jgi:hypothetical protein
LISSDASAAECAMVASRLRDDIYKISITSNYSHQKKQWGQEHGKHKEKYLGMNRNAKRIKNRKIPI